ncbi:hypothetical protein JCM10213_004489 [Rhodosporidiobolus nylandii]
MLAGDSLEAHGRDFSAYVQAATVGATALAELPAKPAELSTSFTATEDDARPFAQRDLGPIPCPPSAGTPERAREVYEREGWMPGIAGEHEEERLKVLRRFGLQDVGQIDAVDKIAETAKAIFGTKAVTVSLMLEDRGGFITTRGWRPEEVDPNRPRLHVGLEASLCKHAMQKSAEDDCFILPSAREDWRFQNNPYCRPGGPVNFFASANVNLPTLILNSCGKFVPNKLPIGSLCLVDSEARAVTMDDRDRTILKNLADLISREIQLGFERKRSAIAREQTAFLGSLSKDSAAVSEAGLDVFASVASNLVRLTSATYCAVVDLRAFRSPSSRKPVRRNSDPNVIHPVTPATSVDSIQPAQPIRPDLARNDSTKSSITAQSSLAESDAPSSAGSVANVSQESAPRTLDVEHEEELMVRVAWGRGRRGSDGRLALLDTAVEAVEGQDLEWDWEAAFGIGEDESQEQHGEEVDDEFGRQRTARLADIKARGAIARKAVSGALLHHNTHHLTDYDASGPSRGPLAPVLPPSTTSYLSVPAFFNGEPTLMIVLGSTQRHFQFEPTDREFASNVGAVLVGSLLRQRLLEADKAKLHFLSQISHELRTPLHGIGTYLELIKETADPAALASINPLLSMADVCTSSLREILDSVLSFSKLAHADASATLPASHPSPAVSSTGPVRQLVDLEQLLFDVVASCWSGSRAKRRALQGEHPADEKAPLDIVLEFDLPKGTHVSVDVGALKRVFTNLVGNSLKYTDHGQIVIAVSSPGLTAGSGVAQVQVDIADTGRGMSPTFVREHLFLPFAQEDAFAEGNGLGTAIADSLLRGMNGTLRYSSAVGVGTTASVSVPLEYAIPASTDLSSPMSSSDPPSSSPSTSHPRPSASASCNFNEAAASSRPRSRRRVLSDELSALLEPGRAATPLASTFPTLQAITPALEALHVDIPPSPLPPGGMAQKLAPPLRDGLGPFSPPLTPPSATPEPASAGATSSSPVVDPSFLVLCVDDNTIARRVLTMYLKSRKVAFVEAADGKGAVAQFEKHRPNLVFCDVQMPNKDGIAATREMRELEEANGWQRARIVAISGLSAELGTHALCVESGQIDVWLTKNGSLKQLSAELEAYRSSLTGAPPATPLAIPIPPTPLSGPLMAPGSPAGVDTH